MTNKNNHVEPMDLGAAIKQILVEVRTAASGFNSTELWGEPDGEEGVSYWDIIEFAEELALSQARVLLSRVEALEKERLGTCEWYKDDPDYDLWESKCDVAWSFSSEGGPTEHGMIYCYKCGKKIEVAQPNQGGE